MMMMMIPLNEIVNPLIIIAAILGCELAFYTFSQYFKTKQEIKSLNTILIFIGLFSLLASTSYQAYGLRQSNVLAEELELFLYKFDILIVLSIFLVFLIITYNPPYDELSMKIINIAIGMFLIVLWIIILIMPQYQDDINNLYTIFVVIFASNAAYIIIKLLSRLKGIVKKRFILISFGGFLTLSGPLLNNQHVGGFLGEIFPIITALLIITGLIIMFFGLYEFPGLLDFDWKKNLSQFFILTRDDYDVLYRFDFRPNLAEDGGNFRPIVIAGVDGLAKALTENWDNQSSKIIKNNYTILIEIGDQPYSNILFLLIIKKEMISMRYILNELKIQFLELYGDLIESLENQPLKETAFYPFNKNIENLIK